MTMPVQLLSVGRVGADLYSNDVGAPLAEVDSFNFFVGGTPANVAVGAQRLGVRSALASRIGDDGIGEGILRFLRQEGVQTDGVVRDPKRRSGLVLLGVQPPDQFPLVFYRDRPADEALSPSDLDSLDLSALQAVFVAGTNLLRRPTHATTLSAIEIARQQSAYVVLDLDHRASLWSRPGEFEVLVRSIVERSHVVMGTAGEVDAAGGQERLLDLLRPHAGVLVIKRGAEGCEVFAEGTSTIVPPFAVEVLNLFGSGDAFAAGYIAGLLQGLDPIECARRGNAAGAHVATRHACANDMPTTTELEEILAGD